MPDQKTFLGRFICYLYKKMVYLFYVFKKNSRFSTKNVFFYVWTKTNWKNHIYPEIQKILVCEEIFPRDVNGVSVLPWKEFLENLSKIIY